MKQAIRERIILPRKHPEIFTQFKLKAEGGVLSITIRQQPDGSSRISLRSSPEVNCSEICAVFGGGGHAMAAGCTIHAEPERARQMLLDVIDEVWK